MSQLLNGRYQINQPIGQGGMGIVYRGYDNHTTSPVAIKQLKAHIAADPTFADQFDRERKVLQQLDHPRIARLLDALETADGDYYLIMEYVPGGSLADLLQKGPLPLEQALEIALDIANALQSVHQLNIIHGDIKPANILLADDGTPRLVDFGTAYVPQKTRLTQTITALGTFAYMSPEACQDEPQDTRTDIWSFGVMLFEMLTGERPFNQPNIAHLTLAIMTEPPQDLQALRPEISDRLADLIYRMLTKDRNWRIPKMNFIIIELDAILYGSETVDTGFLAREIALGEEKSHNLPLLTTPLIGRQQELTELERLLLDPAFRLITLHGPGGIGKTSLALQAAHNFHRQTQTNTYFVNLSSIADPQQIITAIADAIQFNFFSTFDPQTELINYLQYKEMLLILDNFEQVSESVNLLSDILFQSFGIKILVTSQDRLNLLEELRLPVHGLAIPEEATYDGLLQSPAVQLFLQSVRHVQPTFIPTEAEMQAIHQICQLVDGMPLGIKLAATSMNLMTPAEIARQIRVGADVLTIGLPDLPARHRSLRSVFEYSWILLKEEEKRDLRFLSVFQGGFERDAARQYGITLPTLNALTDKSLLRRSPETGRYDLPIMFRHFAADKLAERPSEQTTAYQSHAHYFLQFLKTRQSHLTGDRQLIALREIDIEIGNILAAWQWSINNKDADGLNLGIEALYAFYNLRGRQQEGVELFFKASQTFHDQPTIVLAKLLSCLGACCRVIGQHDDARQYLQQSLNLARSLNDKRQTAVALYQLGLLQGTDPAARTHLETSLALAREIGDQPLTAEILNWLAFAHYQQGNLKTAEKMLKASLT
ncbi:MAG: protein kinase, partial [Ardenticatenaceae bacterium]|nr:protein kinase [Ardenticatenaceae bacterium]